MNASAYMYLTNGKNVGCYSIPIKMVAEGVWSMIDKEVEETLLKYPAGATLEQISLNTSIWSVSYKPQIFNEKKVVEIGNSICELCQSRHEGKLENYRIEIDTVGEVRNFDEFAKLWKKHQRVVSTFSTQARLSFGKLIVNPNYKFLQKIMETVLPEPLVVIEETES